MNQKSTKSPGTVVSNLSAEQAADLSTSIKIETKKLNSRNKPGVRITENIDEHFEDIDAEIEANGGRDVDMSRRVYEVNGKKFRIRQRNPWALWYIVGNGPLPTALQGSFTNLQEVENALARWQAHESKKGSIAREYSEKLEEAGFFDKE